MFPFCVLVHAIELYNVFSWFFRKIKVYNLNGKGVLYAFFDFITSNHKDKRQIRVRLILTYILCNCTGSTFEEAAEK